MTEGAAGGAGQEGAGRPRVLLTDYPWPDCEVEREILDAADFELVTGPREASPAAVIERLVARAGPGRHPHLLGAGFGRSDRRADRSPHRRPHGRRPRQYCNSRRDRARRLGHQRPRLLRRGGVRPRARADPLLVSRRHRARPRGQARASGSRAARRSRAFACSRSGWSGLGRIGRATARKLSGFGCRVIAADPSPHAPPEGVEIVSLEALRGGGRRHRPPPAAARGDPSSGRRRIPRRLPAEATARQCQPRRVWWTTMRCCARSMAACSPAQRSMSSRASRRQPPELVGRPDVIVTPHVAFLSPVSLLELRRRSTEEVVRVLRGQPPRLSLQHAGARRKAVRRRRRERHPRRRHDERQDRRQGGASGAQGRSLLAVRSRRVRWSRRKRLKTIAELVGEGAVPKVLWIDAGKASLRNGAGRSAAAQLEGWICSPAGSTSRPPLAPASFSARCMAARAASRRLRRASPTSSSSRSCASAPTSSGSRKGIRRSRRRSSRRSTACANHPKKRSCMAISAPRTCSPTAAMSSCSIARWRTGAIRASISPSACRISR